MPIDPQPIVTGPHRLVTLNTAPERAKRLIGRVIEDMKEKYTIIYTENIEKIEDVQEACRRHHPDLLFCASMWTPEESEKAQAIAREAVPDIRTMALPAGLQVEKGPEAVVEYIKDALPRLLGS